MMEASRASASRRDDGPGDRSRPIRDTTTTSDDPRDDRSIVDAVLAGDRDAYRYLVDRDAAAVVRACHRILGDLHEAEDAAQEAFVTAYRSLAGWRGDGPFGAWLTRIAVRISLRQVGQRRQVTWLDPSGSGPGGIADAGSAAADAQGVEARPRTDPAMLGRTMSFMMLGSVIAAPLSLALAAIVVDTHAGVMFVAAGLLVVGSGIVAFASGLQHRMT